MQQSQTQPTAAPLSVDASSAIGGALLAAQRAVDGVEKGARNKHQGYDYASADDVIAAARQWLNSAGLALSYKSGGFVPLTPDVAAAVREPGKEASESGNVPAGFLHTTYTLEHASSGESRDYPIMCPVVVSRGRPIDKAMFAAKTSGLAYFLRELLLIDREDRDGGVDGRNDAPAARKAPPPPPPVAKPADSPAAVVPTPTATPVATPTADAKPAEKPAAEYPEIVALATPTELAKMGAQPIDEAKAKTYLVALRARREGEKAAGASAGATKSLPTTAPTTTTAAIASATNGSKPGKGTTTPLPG